MWINDIRISSSNILLTKEMETHPKENMQTKIPDFLGDKSEEIQEWNQTGFND